MPDPTATLANAPDAQAAITGPAYGVLARKHETYERRSKAWAELDDLYEGGYALDAKAEQYMPARPGEGAREYQERVHGAAYLNYLAQIADFFAGALFTDPLSIKQPVLAGSKETAGDAVAADKEDAYTLFERDADEQGHTFSDVLKSAVTKALLKGWTWLQLDFPAKGDDEIAAVQSRADEDDARPYVIDVDPESVINWKCDRHGKLEWAMVYTKRDAAIGPFDPPGFVVHEFTLWKKSLDESGKPVVTFERYALKIEASKEVQPTQAIPLAVEPTVVSFAEIPLIRLELPDGLWAGNKLGKVVLEHWTRRCDLRSSQKKSLFALPYLKEGPEIPGVGEAFSEPTEDTPRDAFDRKGYARLGAKDELGFMEPTGKAYEIEYKQIVDVKDECFRIIHQMAASAPNSNASVGRSGLSKQEDRKSETTILTALGGILRGFGVSVYVAITSVLGGDTRWEAHGLDSYDSPDRPSLVLEMQAAPLFVDAIPSATFKKQYWLSRAEALLESATPEVLDKIRDEIEAGVDAHQERDDLANEAEDTTRQAVIDNDGAPPVAKPSGPFKS